MDLEIFLEFFRFVDEAALDTGLLAGVWSADRALEKQNESTWTPLCYLIKGPEWHYLEGLSAAAGMSTTAAAWRNTDLLKKVSR
jgi:hypothetical protein